jgi:hypothetical protein
MGNALYSDKDKNESRTRWLSNQCCLVREGGIVVVAVGGAPLFRFVEGDRVESRIAATVIAESKVAPVREIVEAFGIDDATLWRSRCRMRDGGVRAILPLKPAREGPKKLKGAIVERIKELRAENVTLRAIGLRLSLPHSTVQGILQREGLCPREHPPHPGLPWTAAADGDPVSVPSNRMETDAGEAVEGQRKQVGPDVEKPDGDVSASEDRAGETCMEAETSEVDPPAPSHEEPVAPGGDSGETEVRARSAHTQDTANLMALIGLTCDGEAEVVFEAREAVPNAGLLLAIPALDATGLLHAARATYGCLRSGVYGLRAMLLTLFFLALLRRPQPEALKGTAPGALGDLLGLLRAPEVKTMRRKLKEVAAAQKAHEFARTLASRWLRERQDALGVLYVDGHVRVYNGKHKISKAHVTQKSLSLRATTDYWVNAADGQPMFVVTTEANAHMTKILPGLLAELEEIGGRKGTVVFDRGGWSMPLFQDLIGQGWHILTYRKGKRDPHPEEGFSKQSLEVEGRRMTYTLSERLVTFRNGLALREIAELREDGGQSIIVTSHREHSAVLLAYRMFERWRQENYFKYMRENFALDALVDYGVEAGDPTREVPNPKRKELDAKVATARSEVAKLEQLYGAAAIDNEESQHPTMRGFKIANGKNGEALRAARERVADLLAQRRLVPKRVPVGTVLGAEGVLRLTPERKLFTDLIKSATYRAETTLLGLLRPHLKTVEKEGRAFLREAVKQRGDLVVTGDEVLVRLAPLSAPRYTAALLALCGELNALEPLFPESRYRLRYEVLPHPAS